MASVRSAQIAEGLSSSYNFDNLFTIKGPEPRGEWDAIWIEQIGKFGNGGVVLGVYSDRCRVFPYSRIGSGGQSFERESASILDIDWLSREMKEWIVLNMHLFI